MKNVVIAGLCVLLAGAATLPAQEGSGVQVPFYGNSECPVCGKPADKAIHVEKGGERVYVCCSWCKGKAKEEFARNHKKAYPRVKDHANAKCVVKRKREAKPDVTLDWQGNRVRFCCKRCIPRFKAAPRRHLTRLENPGLKILGNKKCPVMQDEPVSADSFVVYKGHIIGLCCAECADEFKKKPAKFAARAGLRSGGGKGDGSGGGSPRDGG